MIFFILFRKERLKLKNNNCKICSEKTVEIYDSQFQIIYNYCKNCDFISMNEKYIVSNEKEKSLYNFHNNSMDNKGYVNMLREFIEKFIKPYVDGNVKALDFGCGPGPVLSELLNENGIKTDIYDPFFFPKKIFINKKYTLITCTEVFEHLKNPIENFKLLDSLLRSNGILALTTLFQPKIEEFTKWWYRRDATHISFYTLNTFKYIASYFNYEIVDFNKKNTCVLRKKD